MAYSKVGIDNYEYRLYFGSNIKDPAKKVTEIPPLHAKQNAFIKIGTINYYIVLSGLKFTRKVYEPGLIEAEATIKPSSGAVCSLSFEEVNELFSMREVELSVVDLGKSKNEDYEKTIAIHYYVYMINSQIKTDCMYVKLTIHSFDKLMTIDLSTAGRSGVEQEDDGTLKAAKLPAEGDVIITSKNITMQTIDAEVADKKYKDTGLAKDGSITIRSKSIGLSNINTTDVEADDKGKVTKATYKPEGFEGWTVGDSGIPNGWTIEEE